jgi:hypothetical protein
MLQAADEDAASKLQTALVKGIASTRELYRGGDRMSEQHFSSSINAARLFAAKVDKDRLVVEQELGTGAGTGAAHQGLPAARGCSA